MALANRGGRGRRWAGRGADGDVDTESARAQNEVPPPLPACLLFIHRKLEQAGRWRGSHAIPDLDLDLDLFEKAVILSGVATGGRVRPASRNTQPAGTPKRATP